MDSVSVVVSVNYINMLSLNQEIIASRKALFDIEHKIVYENGM